VSRTAECLGGGSAVVHLPCGSCRPCGPCSSARGACLTRLRSPGRWTDAPVHPWYWLSALQVLVMAGVSWSRGPWLFLASAAAAATASAADRAQQESWKGHRWARGRRRAHVPEHSEQGEGRPGARYRAEQGGGVLWHVRPCFQQQKAAEECRPGTHCSRPDREQRTR